MTSSTDLVQPPFSYSWPLSSSDCIQMLAGILLGMLPVSFSEAPEIKTAQSFLFLIRCLACLSRVGSKSAFLTGEEGWSGHRCGMCWLCFPWMKQHGCWHPLKLNPRYLETSVRPCTLNTAVIDYTQKVVNGGWRHVIRAGCFNPLSHGMAKQCPPLVQHDLQQPGYTIPHGQVLIVHYHALQAECQLRTLIQPPFPLPMESTKDHWHHLTMLD